MRAQQGAVAGAASHYYFDGAFFGVGVVPVGPQAGNLVVQVGANVAAHGHNHGLASLCGVAFFKVGYQVSGHAGYARLGTYYFF